MSKITKIQIQKLNKSKFNIFVDEEYKLSVSQESLIRLNLKVGMQFDETEILLEENKNSALQKTLEYLGRRLYSKGELREKLFKKGFGEDSIDYALEKAENFGYLNDEEFAEKFANDKQKLSKWGRKKIEFELHKKRSYIFSKKL
jgi:regulatory protein